MKPTLTQYLITYPAAIKLWQEGKHQEAVANFVKSPANLIIVGEDKADYYAYARQESMRQTKAAALHQAQTDALCKGVWEMSKNWPTGSLLETNPAYVALVREIDVRREEWMRLYGIYSVARRARQNAIRLKAFVRRMRLMRKCA